MKQAPIAWEPDQAQREPPARTPSVRTPDQGQREPPARTPSARTPEQALREPAARAPSARTRDQAQRQPPARAPSARRPDLEQSESHPSTVVDGETAYLWRRLHRRQKIGIALGAIAFVVLAMCLVERPLRLVERMNVQSVSRVDVRVDVPGVLVDVPKKVGDSVKEGEVLAVLENRDLIARVETIEKQIAQIKEGIVRIQARTPSYDPEAIRRLFARRSAELEEAMATLHSEPKAKGKGGVDPMVAARADLDRKQKAFNVARALLNRSTAAQHLPDLHAKEAALVESLRAAREDLLRLEIKSPISGTIVAGEGPAKRGSSIERGQAILQIAKSDMMRAEVLVPETELDAVKIGQPVVMKVRSYPGIDFVGKVDDIAAVASPVPMASPAENVVRVGVFVKNERGLLWDGMTGYAQVNCGPKPLTSLFFHPLVSWMRLRFFL
jgi:multidrug resistance efflux pump